VEYKQLEMQTIRSFSLLPLLASYLVISLQPLYGQSAAMTNALDEGMAAMRAGQPTVAEERFRQVITSAPDNPLAHLDLGLALLREGRLLEAAAAIQQAIQINPSLPGAHLFLGIIEYQRKNNARALADLKQEVSLSPQNPQALLWLGIVQLEAGHPDEASEALDRAAALDPKNMNILDYRGQAHMAAAKQSYAQMYQLDPRSWRVHRLNAQIAADAGQHSQAISEYKAAIAVAPKEADLYEGLGEEYRKVGHLEDAQKAFEQELKLTPGNPVAMYNLGSVDIDRNENAAGIPLLQQVVKTYSHPTVADYYLGRGLAAEAKYDEAVTALQRAAIVPGEVGRRAWYELSQTYRKMGQTANAQNALIKFQQLQQAANRASAMQMENWRKLNAGDSASADTTTK
jgi:tetratricopeptide (TPR) repeat protein